MGRRGRWTGRAALSVPNAFPGSKMIRGRRSCLYRFGTRAHLGFLAVQLVERTHYGEAHADRVYPDREGM